MPLVQGHRMAAVIPTFTTLFHQGTEGQGGTLVIYVSFTRKAKPSQGAQPRPGKISIYLRTSVVATDTAQEFR